MKFQSNREELLKLGIRDAKMLCGNAPVYVFGTTFYAAKIACFAKEKGCKELVFIDDYKAGASFHEFPVIRLDEADKSKHVISSVIEGRPKAIYNLLKEKGFKDPGSYFYLNLFDAKVFGIPFTENNLSDIEQQADKYSWLEQQMADDQSKKELRDVLCLRYTNDYRKGDLTYRLAQQYWEPFIDYSKVNAFVDCGGYDGKTTREFISMNPSYENVYLFEPFKDSMEMAKKTLADIKNIQFYSKAVYDKKTELLFDVHHGSANHISEKGTVRIKTCCLDDELEGLKIDMIKMDVEGAELLALEGAKKIITFQRPVLAICVYHDQQHFWKIPAYILSLKKDYKVFLRHYTEGIYETVMYFV